MQTEILDPAGADSTAGQSGMQLDRAIGRTQRWLLERQAEAGHWLGLLEADASVAAGYPVVQKFMGNEVSRERREKIIRYCLARQLPEGGWPAYHGGPADLNVSIQVYFGLKLAGLTGENEAMQRARRVILDLGGIGRSSVFTKIWLALFGQFDWRWTPSVPPEIIFLPKWFNLNIYEFASWSRQTIMALAVVTTLHPVCRLSESEGVGELYAEPPEARRYTLGRITGSFGWRNFFLLTDRLIKLYERSPIRPGRKKALAAVEAWISHRQEADGGWGGIMLPWIYSLFAYKALGHGPDHPGIGRGMEGLETFLFEDEQELLLQPAMSPVWDTAWAAVALEESGLAPDHPALVRAGQWLLSQEVQLEGDWRIKNPTTPPGGWAFEFENDWYPDMDDSAVVPRALLGMRLEPEDERRKLEAIRRSRVWVLAMQSADGGWAAFDRDNTREALAYVPFSEFMSPLDPTCADVTAHVVEFLTDVLSDGDAEANEVSLRKALDYLRRTQEKDGAWYGRWGVNYVYGTALALTALAAAGERGESGTMQAGYRWLIEKQNQDGGWGETCETYSDPSLRGCGISTPSQTAWALIGLSTPAALAQRQSESGLMRHGGERRELDPEAAESIRRGVRYLLENQQEDGSWIEPQFTGGGFPKVFFLKYELYKIYFPLLALARCQAALNRLDGHVPEG